MPTGRLVTAPEAELDHAGSSNLLDDQTSVVERNLAGFFSIVRGTGVSVIPDVIDQTVLGRRVRLWDQIFFGIIHVIPRKKDVGAVVSQIQYQVEIWNADDSPHDAQSVSIEGSSGVSLTGGPTLPATWAPFSSQFVTVVVDAEGDPVIDTRITWLFPGFTGTDHEVVGFRLTIYPLPPLWNQGVDEAVGWLTDVQRARDGSEQRRQLLSKEIRELSYVGFSADPVTTGEIMVKLFNAGHFLFGAPYWPDAIHPTADVALGAVTIALDTTTRLFTVGGLGILWRDEKNWEAFTVKTVTPTSLDLESPTSLAWSASDTFVIPLFPARVVDSVKLERPSPGKAEIRARFRTEPV